MRTLPGWLRYLVIALSGAAGLGLLAGPSHRMFRKYARWQEASCVIQRVEVIEEQDDEGKKTKHAVVTFTLEREGRTYLITERDPRKAGKPEQAAAKLPVETRVSCRYDPQNPSLASLDVASFPAGVLLAGLVPLSWLLIGLGGIWAHIPRGRLSARAIPRELAFRLEPAPSGDDEVFTSWFGIFFGLFWNGALTPFLLGAPEALPCLSLHLGVGGFFTWAWAKPVLQRLRLGDTVVEVSREGLFPGASFDVKVVQPGAASIHAVRVGLCCEEVAEYTEGTTTRTERHEATRIELASDFDVRISPARPLVLRGSGALPPDAMTTFEASNNQIRWFFRVQIDAPGMPPREEQFPVRVGPEAPL